jgi:hypothetical protein
MPGPAAAVGVTLAPLVVVAIVVAIVVVVELVLELELHHRRRANEKRLT